MVNYRNSYKPPVQRVQVKYNRPVRIRKVAQIPTKPVRRSIKPSQPISNKIKPPVPKQPDSSRAARLTRPSKPVVKPVKTKTNRAVSRASVRPRRSNTRQALTNYQDAIKRLRDVGRGKALVMVACGPSITEVPLERLVGHPRIDIMCINKPDKRVWPSTYWAFCDQSQYSRNKTIWDTYSGLVINSSSVRMRKNNQILIKNISGKGFSRDLLRGYYIGRSSTYANLQVAFWANYDRIYVFGLDMGAVNGKLHFYGQNPDVSNENRLKRFDREAESYLYAATNILKEEAKRVVLCSDYNKRKFTEYYSRLPHKEAVETILKGYGKE